MKRSGAATAVVMTLLLAAAAGCGGARREWTSLDPGGVVPLTVLPFERDGIWARPGEIGATSLEWEIVQALERAGFEVARAEGGDAPAGYALKVDVTTLPAAAPGVLSTVVFEVALLLEGRTVFEKLYGRPVAPEPPEGASAFESVDRALERVAREVAQDLVAWCRENRQPAVQTD